MAGDRTLLVQTGFLGDVLLSTPVIRYLRGALPTTELWFLTTPAAKDLVAEHPELSGVEVFDKRRADRGLRGLKSMASRLKALDFTRAFTLHKSWRTAALLKLSGIETRIGFQESAASWSYSQTFSRREFRHEVQRNAAILQYFGENPEEFKLPMELFISQKARDIAQEKLGSCTRVIAFAPGSVWPTKRWTIEGFSEVARELKGRGYSVVVLGSADDRPLGDKIRSACNSEAINLCGECSLLTSAAIIDRSLALVSNDSAPLHMAAALNTPVVSVFCATVPEQGFGPWQVPHRVVHAKGLPCRPCGRHGKNYCPTGTHACQLAVWPEHVVSALEQLL